MTRTVSSPATVPSIAGQAAWSMAEARNCAAPAGVRSTTRLALASAEVSSSLRYLTRRDDTPPAGTPGWAGGLSWPGCGCPAAAARLRLTAPGAASRHGTAGRPRAACRRVAVGRGRLCVRPGGCQLGRGRNGRVEVGPHPFWIIESGTRVRVRVAWQRVEQGAVLGAQPDDAELVQVTGQRGLRDVHAGVLPEQAGQLFLGVDVLPGEDRDDPPLPGRLGRGNGGRLPVRASRRAQFAKQCQKCRSMFWKLA